MHDGAPRSAYVPAAHSIRELSPLQLWPAGHSEQVVRVVWSPPEVKKPPVQVVQFSAPSELYSLSAPHAEHSLEPSKADVPSRHSFRTLEPSHEEPAGHNSQAVRVFPSSVPPDVYEPAGHSAQLSAPAELYILSSPHAEHALEPAVAYVPALQITIALVPLHE